MHPDRDPARDPMPHPPKTGRARNMPPGLATDVRTGPVDMRYLEGTLGYTLRRAQMAVFQDIYRAFGDAGGGITLTQFSVMAVAADNPDITQTELAEVLAVERPRIVPILDGLEARGLALRRVCGVDRRNRRITLTDAGARLLAELKHRFALHEARVALALGAERAAVHAALQALQGLAAPGDPAAD